MRNYLCLLADLVYFSDLWPWVGTFKTKNCINKNTTITPQNMLIYNCNTILQSVLIY